MFLHIDEENNKKRDLKGTAFVREKCRWSVFNSDHRKWFQPLTFAFFCRVNRAVWVWRGYGQNSNPKSPQTLVTWPWHHHFHNTAPCLCSDWDFNKDMCLWGNPPTAVHGCVLPLSIRFWIYCWLTQQKPPLVTERQRVCGGWCFLQRNRKETSISIWRFVNVKEI